MKRKTPTHAHIKDRLQRPIVLVGMMGAGKTTVGRRLAEALGVNFYDADAEIEKSSGMKIADFFEAYGEEEFRHGERRVIERLLNDTGVHVLATGGGAFIRDETRNLIKARAISLWLQADIDLLVSRTAKRNTRPLLRTGDPKEILTRLLAEREPYYQRADIIIESYKAPHRDIVEKILIAIEAHTNQPHIPAENASISS